MSEKYTFDQTMASIMQRNLKEIRESLGWTSENLANLIGVTKQTISNIETRKSKLSKLHYIAIRTVVDFEITQLKEIDSDKAKKAELLIKFLFESEEIHKKYKSGRKREEILEASQLIAKSSSYSTALKVVDSILPVIAAGLTAATILLSTTKTRKK